MPPTRTTKPQDVGTLPPYPSKLIDYSTLNNSQFYERAGRVMNLSNTSEIKRAIKALVEDPIVARHLIQQMEHEDAETIQPTPSPEQPSQARRSLPAYMTHQRTRRVQNSGSNSTPSHSQQSQEIHTFPPYPSTGVNYMDMTEEQFYQRMSLVMNCPDRNRLLEILKYAGDLDTMKVGFQKQEQYLAERRARNGVVQFGGKPIRDELAHYVDIGNNTTIRFWKSGQRGVYSLDFVYSDDRSRHRRKSMTIKLLERPFGAELFSIENALDKARDSQGRRVCPPAAALGDPRYDPEWETFLVPEGAVIDVVQPKLDTITFMIPGRQGGELAVVETFRIQ
ncbi:hypothetical protein BDQ17DRAFT_1326617 [Cyathus striatus]|nr:hypothetical protein BDQ17DRAFT_1326617 [Cyathus striatus]